MIDSWKILTQRTNAQNFAEILEQSALDYTDLQVIYDSDYMPFESKGYVVVGVYDGG